MSNFKSDNHPLQYRPESFVQEIEALCAKMDEDIMPYELILMEAVSVIKRYKDLGLSCQEAYDMIEPIFRHCTDGSSQVEFIGDILDCICGYVGNIEYQIY